MNEVERKARLESLYRTWVDARTRADLAREQFEAEVAAAVADNVRPATIARWCGVTRQAAQRWLRNAGVRP